MRAVLNSAITNKNMKNLPLNKLWAFPSGSMVKNLPSVQETWVGSLGQKDPLEECMTTHSSVFV